MNDQTEHSRAIVPRKPNAIIPAPLVRAAQKAAPVAGGALLMWAGRRALDAFAAMRQRRAASEIEIDLPARPRSRLRRPASWQTYGTVVEIHYRARWIVARRTDERD